MAPEGALTYDQFAQRPTLVNPLSAAMAKVRAKLKAAPNLETEPTVDKPRVDILYLGNESKVQIPRLALTYWEQYELSYLCAAMSSAQIKTRDEVFRHKGRFKALWQRKCTVCQKTYAKNIPQQTIQGPSTVDPASGMEVPGPSSTVEYCEGCKSTGTLVRPTEDELFHLKKLFKKANNAGQSIWDVLKMFEDDLNITDDAWLVAIPRYYRDARTGQIYYRVEQVVRGHPNIMRIVADGKGNRGGAFLSCPFHRDFIYNLGMATAAKKERGYFYSDAHSVDWSQAPKHCPKCKDMGRDKVPLMEVWYVATEAGGQKPVAFYFEHEVYHKSKFRPTMLYSAAGPIVTLYREARSLIKMEEYIQEYFEKRMIPRGMVIIRRSPTAPQMGSPAVAPPQKGVEDFKSDINRRMQDNHHDIPFVGISHADDIQFVPFADKIQEMEFIPVREEFKRNIASFYGLSPLFMAQTEESGGMNNESQQITVTNRALEAAQSIYNDEDGGVFSWLLSLCNVQSFSYELTGPERQDRIAEVQEQLAWAELATIMQNELGFEVLSWDSENKRMIFSEKPNRDLMSQGGSGYGGQGMLGDESQGRSFKPPAPSMQDNEGSPKTQRRGDTR